MLLRDQSQSQLRVSRDTKAIEAPKIPAFCVNLTVSCPFTLVPIKKSWKYPLLKRSANPRLTRNASKVIKFKFASFNTDLDFRRKLISSDRASLSRNNGIGALGTKFDLQLNGNSWLRALLRYTNVIVPTIVHVPSLPLVQPRSRLLEQMSKCVVGRHDKGFEAPFKATPPMIYSLIDGLL
jgi:hypothetical protein